MAWDTQYRPPRYDSVIGQEGHAAVLREFVRGGTGFQQSYLFCGPWGSGKTTMGRILARALLCSDPKDGDPCDECPSCIQLLKSGASDAFVEFDAATNSGKEDIKKIVESLQYATFSGKRRIYLIDESHQLSKSALDALLKVMEDNIPGSDDKWLICIFCTTEPNNMRDTIFSRCAPAFTIRKCSPEKVADRLAYICDQEDVEYDLETLRLVSAVKKCHFRDAIKAVETIANFGPINQENVGRVLNLNVYSSYMNLLNQLGRAEAACQEALDELLQVNSPAHIYTELCALFMLAYRAALGIARTPPYLDGAVLKKAGTWQGSYLLAFANHLASRPARPTEAALRCDISMLHHMRVGNHLAAPPKVQTPSTTPAVEQALRAVVSPSSDPGRVSRPQARTVGGVHVDDRAVNRDHLKPDSGPSLRRLGPRVALLPASGFRKLLEDTLGELTGDGKGHTR